MVHVITTINRPPKELIDQFQHMSVATVYEASDRKGFVDYHIKPIAEGVRICGPAFTVECHPKDNLMLHKALEKARSGDVIVASAGGFYEAGYWGEMMGMSATAKEIGGLAIDGCVRDSAALVDLGFPIFCRGFAIAGTTKTVLGLINHPILFGGAPVNPGDIVLGDGDGLVIVDQASAVEVLEKSRMRMEMEKEKSALLKKGVSSIEINRLDKVFESLGLKEE